LSSSSSSSNSTSSSSSSSDGSTEADEVYDDSDGMAGVAFTYSKDGSKIDKGTGMVIKIAKSRSSSNSSNSKDQIEIAPLTAKIKSVSNKGEINIEFSEDIVTPENYTKFNSLFLKVKLTPNEGANP
jgi:hypothetical protein